MRRDERRCHVYPRGLPSHDAHGRADVLRRRQPNRLMRRGQAREHQLLCVWPRVRDQPSRSPTMHSDWSAGMRSPGIALRRRGPCRLLEWPRGGSELCIGGYDLFGYHAGPEQDPGRMPARSFRENLHGGVARDGMRRRRHPILRCWPGAGDAVQQRGPEAVHRTGGSHPMPLKIAASARRNLRCFVLRYGSKS